MLIDEITNRIIAAAMKVHSAFGAGLLESTYDACFCHQLTRDGLHFEHQVKLPVVYDGVELEAGYRIDFLIKNCVIVELKAVEKLLPLHTAQLITYLRLTEKQVGLLINFNVPHLRDGIRRVVNRYADEPTPRVSQNNPRSASSASLAVESSPGVNDHSSE